jgi:hypothetical protein
MYFEARKSRRDKDVCTLKRERAGERKTLIKPFRREENVNKMVKNN